MSMKVKSKYFAIFFIFLFVSVCADHVSLPTNKVCVVGQIGLSAEDKSKISDVCEVCDSFDNDGDGMIDEADEDIPFSVFISGSRYFPLSGGRLKECIETETGYPNKGTNSGRAMVWVWDFKGEVSWSVTYYVINSFDELGELCKNSGVNVEEFKNYVDFTNQTMFAFVFSTTIPIVYEKYCPPYYENLIGYVSRIGSNIFIKWNERLFFIQQQKEIQKCPAVVPPPIPPPYYNVIITHKKVFPESVIVKRVDSQIVVSQYKDNFSLEIQNIENFLKDYCPGPANPEEAVPQECLICLRNMEGKGSPPDHCYMELKKECLFSSVLCGGLKVSKDECQLSSDFPECSACKKKLIEIVELILELKEEHKIKEIEVIEMK